MPKPPKPNLTAVRKAQRETLEALAAGARKLGETAVNGLREIDKTHKITDRVRNVGAQLAHEAARVDQQTGLSDRARTAARAGAQKAHSLATSAKQHANEHGVTAALSGFNEQVLQPAKAAFVTAAQSGAVQGAVRSTQRGYGRTRAAMKDVFYPVLPTYDLEKLLGDIAAELNYVAGCLMQISRGDSAEISSRFGRVLAAKLAGVGVAAGFTGMVAAFGTAGTGTAIASLSGAAATKATLAWVGGLVGGGAAAGAAVTAGITLVVGAITVSLLSSRPRDFEQLTTQEQRVLQTCWLTSAMCNEMRARYRLLGVQEVVDLYEQALRPLYEEIQRELEALCSPLDGANATALREHALRDLAAVLDIVPAYLSWRHSDAGLQWAEEARREALAEGRALPPPEASGAPYTWPRPLTEDNLMYAIGGAIAALISGQPLEQSPETDMMLNAVRRYASKALGDADVYEMREYVQEHWDNPVWRAAFGRGVLGHFQEQLVLAERATAVHGAEASLFDDPHHPGGDIKFTSFETGEIVQEIQVKATATGATVHEALRAHPNIHVVVNKDVADHIDDSRVSASHHTYDEIRQPTDAFLHTLNEHTTTSRVERSAATAAAVATLAELTQMMRGEREFPEAVVSAVGKTGTAAAATLVTALLFG